MATTNLFNLLDGDAEDPSLLISAQISIVTDNKASPPNSVAKLPTKPLPPSQAVREGRKENGRGGRGFGRGRNESTNDDTFSNGNGVAMGFKEEREKTSERRGGYGGSRGGYRGGRRGGFANGEGGEGERSRRVFDRRSGTGRGGEIKREGAGCGNWGTTNDEISQMTEEPVVENEAILAEKLVGEEENVDVEKENPDKEVEPEEKQMTLEEYEKVLEEKRKALLSLKGEERKVDLDKDFESMQLVSKKKNDDEVFIKLGSEDKRKEGTEKEERAKKSVSINEFLKPSEGNGYYNRRGGRGRGRVREGYGGYGYNNVSAPSIEDPKHFPSLVAS